MHFRSAGVLLHEMAALTLPFIATNMPALMLRIVSRKIEQLPSHCSVAIAALVRLELSSMWLRSLQVESLLNLEPSLRPVAKRVIRYCVYFYSLINSCSVVEPVASIRSLPSFLGAPAAAIALERTQRIHRAPEITGCFTAD